MGLRRYQVDFQMAGTCYVRAENEEAAKLKFEEYVGKNSMIELNGDHWLDDEGHDRISAAMTPSGEMSKIEESGEWFGDEDYPKDEDEDEDEDKDATAEA